MAQNLREPLGGKLACSTRAGSVIEQAFLPSGKQHGPSKCRLLLLQPRAHRFHRPLFIGKLAGLQLGINQVAIHLQLEGAPARRDQVQILDLLLVRRQQLARQTDGLRFIVSHRAVFELDVHFQSPCSVLLPLRR